MFAEGATELQKSAVVHAPCSKKDRRFFTTFAPSLAIFRLALLETRLGEAWGPRAHCKGFVFSALLACAALAEYGTLHCVPLVRLCMEDALRTDNHSGLCRLVVPRYHPFRSV